MGKKAAGIAPKVAKTAWNGVKTDLANLGTHMSDLVKDVEEMNSSIWYGGKVTNKWYDKIRTHYCTGERNLVKFHKQISNVQDAFESFFRKVSAANLFDD